MEKLILLLMSFIEKILQLIKKSFKIWVSLLILIILIKKINVGEIAKSVSLVEPAYLLISLSLIPIFEIIRCTKWQMILKKLKYNIPIKNLLIDNLKSYPLNVVTPSNIGDLIRAYYVYKRGVPNVESAASVISDRLFDILSTLIIGVLGFFILPIVSSIVSKISIIIFILFIILLFYIYVKEIMSIVLRIINTVFKLILKDKYISQSQVNQASDMLLKIMLDKKTFIKGVSLGLIQWAIIIIQFKIILLSFGYDQYLPEIAAVIGISWLAALVPITISGLGIREGVGVFLFGLIGIPSNVAFTSFLLTIILYQIILCVIGLILLIKNK